MGNIHLSDMEGRHLIGAKELDGSTGGSVDFLSIEEGGTLGATKFEVVCKPLGGI